MKATYRDPQPGRSFRDYLQQQLADANRALAQAQSPEQVRELNQQRARLLDQMGKIYENLGLYDQSASLLERAVAVRRKLPTPDEVALASSLKALAELRITCERHVAARSTSTELEVAGQIARHHDRLVRETTRRVAALDIEIGRCREPAADPARQRAVRALADRLAVLADPDTPDPEIQDPEIPEPGPPVRATLGTDDEEGR